MEDKNTYIYQLFLNYISGEITKKDSLKLRNWIALNSANKKEFTDYLRLHKIAQGIRFSENFDKEDAWENIVGKLEDDGKFLSQGKKEDAKVRTLRPLRNLLKYAAIFIGVLGGAYFYLEISGKLSSDFKTSEENKITLQSNDGEIKVLLEKNSQHILNQKGEVIGTQSGNEIRYAANSSSEKLRYNQLSVPYGKTFSVFLSDSSEVVLNSGTTFKYPVNFIKGTSRKVYLDGEAYFKVTKNKTDAFIVETTLLSTKVFGTEFNMSSYSNEVKTTVVLVEGSVGVFKSGTIFDSDNGDPYLSPGQLASVDKSQNSIKIENVDTYVYTAWLNGVLFIRNEPFLKIAKKLERKYNVIIDNQYEALNNEMFTAKFDVENVSSILDAFKKIHPFNYEITNHRITITP